MVSSVGWAGDTDTELVLCLVWARKSWVLVLILILSDVLFLMKHCMRYFLTLWMGLISPILTLQWAKTFHYKTDFYCLSFVLPY